MKVIEVLKLNEGALNICRNAGIRMEDVEFINLYNEYARLFAEGEKVSYIVAVLSCKYGICERKVYALIKRFKSDCNSLIFGGGVIISLLCFMPTAGLKMRCMEDAAA